MDACRRQLGAARSTPTRTGKAELSGDKAAMCTPADGRKNTRNKAFGINLPRPLRHPSCRKAVRRPLSKA